MMGLGVMAETVEWRNANGFSTYFQIEPKNFLMHWLYGMRETAKKKWFQGLQV